MGPAALTSRQPSAADTGPARCLPAIYAENHFFKTAPALTPDPLIRTFNGATIFETGTLVGAACDRDGTDVVGAWNVVNEPDLSEAVLWTPALVADLQATKRVPASGRGGAGPFER